MSGNWTFVNDEKTGARMKVKVALVKNTPVFVIIPAWMDESAETYAETVLQDKIDEAMKE